MLQFFRNLFKTKLGVGIAIGFLVLIALAFASADVSSSGNFGGVAGGDRVATVGKDRIDTAALSQAATSALENIKQDDPKVSMKAFLAAGGLDKVLEEMIDRTALTEFGRKHGLVASQRLVDSEITKLAAFKGPDGKFSETAFRQALQQRGLSEALVRDDLAAGLVARQVLVPAAFGARAPRELALRYAGLLRESRSGAIALVPAAAFAPAAPPSDKDLADFYAKSSDRFIQPERRTLRYAVFGDSVLKDLPAPNDAEVAARYNANKALYAASEDRRVTQLIVPTEAAAKTIAAEVAKGTPLERAAAAKGLATAAVGTLNRQALAGQTSAAVADAAFAAAQGSLAAPARSALGWHVVRVDEIIRKPERKLADVRGEIVKVLTEEKRRAAINDLSARLEEEFEQGLTLADVAKELGLDVSSTGLITADGRPYAGNTTQPDPVVGRVISAAFAMEKEGEPQLAEIDPGKQFIIYDVGEIQPSAPAPLAAIKADVTAAWMLEKGAAAAKDAAARIVALVRKGTTLEAALSSAGKPIPPAQQVAMNRQDLAQMQNQVPAPVALMFSMAEGTVKMIPAGGDRGWFVVSLKDIVPGKVDAADPVIAAAQRELGTMAGREYAEALRRAIRAEVGVEKNPDGIRAVRSRLDGGN